MCICIYLCARKCACACSCQSLSLCVCVPCRHPQREKRNFSEVATGMRSFKPSIQFFRPFRIKQPARQTRKFTQQLRWLRGQGGNMDLPALEDGTMGRFPMQTVIEMCF